MRHIFDKAALFEHRHFLNIYLQCVQYLITEQGNNSTKNDIPINQIEHMIYEIIRVYLTWSMVILYMRNTHLLKYY